MAESRRPSLSRRGRRSYKSTSSRKSRRDYPGPTPLDSGAILHGVGPATRPLISDVVVVEETRSTNDDLLALPTRERHGRVLLAERQTAGKGRRGRPWHSPPGNIWLSVGWRFSAALRDLSDLPLLAGVCVCRALARCGLEGQRIKRPNDILVGGAKLCGILVETRGGQTGCEAVTGIGINVRQANDAGDHIDQPWTDLDQQLGSRLPARNILVASLLDELLPRFRDETGMAAFLAETSPEWTLDGDKS